VLVADLNKSNGSETLAVAKAQGHGDSIAFRRCDVADEADMAATVAEAVKRFGRLDIAFLNAGVGGAFGPIAETGVEDWDYTFAVLVRSVFLGMKHASLAMRKLGDGGVILVTASIAGMVGGGGSHAYSAAKAAVISLIENVAAELGPQRIRVVGIAPGVISTPLLHRGKPERYEAQFRRQPWPDRGEPEVIADVASFLVSDEARFITGETVKVDGGLLAQGVALFGTARSRPSCAPPASIAARPARPWSCAISNRRVKDHDQRSAAPARASHRPARLTAIPQHAGAGARPRDARPQHRRDGGVREGAPG
jgi:NAD(P)-dependent dehydrogenase (short-subunit alcohol dehydrogenase family)